MRFAVFSLALLALAACAQTYKPEAPFNAAEAAPILQKGTGTIEGEAFLRRDYGRLVTAAGERVSLIPATSYAQDRFGKMFAGEKRAYSGVLIEDTPPDYYRYQRETKVDMKGHFTFEHVMPGRYIVATRIFWTEPDAYLPQGGAVYDIVEVKKDETVKAVISGR